MMTSLPTGGYPASLVGAGLLEQPKATGVTERAGTASALAKLARRRLHWCPWDPSLHVAMSELTKGINGLPCLTLVDPSGGRAQIYLHGGQVTRWVDGRSRDHLYVSRWARFEDGESIRGGIPVVFPQFSSDGHLPKHGLLRTRKWSVAAQGESRAALVIEDDAATRAIWPHHFIAELTVSLEEGLTVGLRITNTGGGLFTFAAALHTYFAVDDVREVRIRGLAGHTYCDHVRDRIEVVDHEPAIQITDRIDRVYRQAARTVRLAGLGARQDLELEADGFGDWVVWNPWAGEPTTLTDMEPEDFRRMLCVEAARITERVTLHAGETWTGVQTMRPMR